MGREKKFTFGDLMIYLVFVLIALFILLPIYKVLVDSLDLRSGYGMRLWPESFSFLGYKIILTTKSLYQPFLISVLVTLVGTLMGLAIVTLGAYVLIQWDMPGRNLFSYFLLFTMIFEGGMIPTYLVMRQLKLINTLWAVILPMSMSVYNLVLMRNFFEGIPGSLLEAAQIDGCSPIGIFFKVVLPLSKAALASIGLMFGVAFWNNYTNFKLYISNRDLYNFQMKLRDMMQGSDMVNTSESIATNTLNNAAVIVAILPFMIIYPFCQNYFVQGVNVGAVKE